MKNCHPTLYSSYGKRWGDNSSYMSKNGETILQMVSKIFADLIVGTIIIPNLIQPNPT